MTYTVLIAFKTLGLFGRLLALLNKYVNRVSQLVGNFLFLRSIMVNDEVYAKEFTFCSHTFYFSKQIINRQGSAEGSNCFRKVSEITKRTKTSRIFSKKWFSFRSFQLL